MKEEKSFRGFLCSDLGGIVLTVVLYAISFLLISLIGWLQIELLAWIGGIIFIIIGWKSLSNIQANAFLIMPIIGWVFYFLIKLVLSFIVGMFISPYKIAQSIRRNLQEGF